MCTSPRCPLHRRQGARTPGVFVFADDRRSSPPDNAAINVRALAVDAEDLTDLQRLPSVDELRPASCPGCHAPARPVGRALGIAGHGTYKRQVRGLAPGHSIVIHVRRYLCLGCEHTISVLPDALLPGRLYAGGAILRVLVHALLLRVAAAALRASVGPGDRTPRWTTPARWASQLGTSLWRFRAAEIGAGKLLSPVEFVARLCGLAGAHPRAPDLELDAAASRLVTGTSHA